MAIIALEGIQIHAYHGFYEEESLAGSDFLLDIYIATNVDGAASKDDLFATVNYEMVYHICLSEMKKPKKLIETVAKNILDRLNKQFEKLQGVKVRLKKLNPPLGGLVASASIEISSGVFDLPSNENLKKIQELKL